MVFWNAYGFKVPDDMRCGAEHAVAADRFAREIVGFWHAFLALAAAERQSVGCPGSVVSIPFFSVIIRATSHRLSSGNSA